MTHPTGNRKPRTVALLPEQDLEMVRHTKEIGKVIGRRYHVSQFMRHLIDKAMLPEEKAQLLAMLREKKRTVDPKTFHVEQS